MMNHLGDSKKRRPGATRVWLIVTVDTEEEGLWSDGYKPYGNTVENIGSTPRFQRLCEAYGIRPTYLVDTPVVEDDRAVDLLGGYRADGRCEIGAHLHPWCGPPFEDSRSRSRTFTCNLDEALQRAKLENLTGAIEHRFGVRPTAFRAGRYGLDIVGARILADLGYVVDSSVICLSDYSTDGGPDFRLAPLQPYWISTTHLLAKAAEADGIGLLEVPVTVGYTRGDSYRFDRWRRRLAGGPWSHLRAVGMLDRLGLVRRVKFSPEQADFPRMRQLVRAMLRRGAHCLVMMLHSSSLLPGSSPYVRNVQDLEAFYRRLEQTFVFCLSKVGMIPATLTEYAQKHASPIRPRQPS